MNPGWHKITVTGGESHFGYAQETTVGGLPFISVRKIRRCGEEKIEFPASDIRNIQELTEQDVRIQTNTKPTLEEIIFAVSEVFEVEVVELKGNQRPNRIAFPRFAICYFARCSGYTFESIQAALNYRDHSAVIHGENRAKDLRQVDRQFRERITEVRKKLNL